MTEFNTEARELYNRFANTEGVKQVSVGDKQYKVGKSGARSYRMLTIGRGADRKSIEMAQKTHGLSILIQRTVGWQKQVTLGDTTYMFKVRRTAKALGVDKTAVASALAKATDADALNFQLAVLSVKAAVTHDVMAQRKSARPKDGLRGARVKKVVDVAVSAFSRTSEPAEEVEAHRKRFYASVHNGKMEIRLIDPMLGKGSFKDVYGTRDLATGKKGVLMQAKTAGHFIEKQRAERQQRGQGRLNRTLEVESGLRQAKRAKDDLRAESTNLGMIYDALEGTDYDGTGLPARYREVTVVGSGDNQKAYLPGEQYDEGDGEKLTLKQPQNGNEVRARLDLMRQVGVGMCAMHATGLTHGDFKPENMLHNSDGKAVLADFGGAREVPTDGERPKAWTPGFVCTADENSRGAATQKQDVFAYARSTVEMLIGRDRAETYFRMEYPYVTTVDSGRLMRDLMDLMDPPQAAALVQACNENPNERPTMPELMTQMFSGIEVPEPLSCAAFQRILDTDRKVQLRRSPNNTPAEDEIHRGVDLTLAEYAQRLQGNGHWVNMKGTSTPHSPQKRRDLMNEALAQSGFPKLDSATPFPDGFTPL